MKFKVTNTSPSSKKGAHAIFFTEVGRLLKPGEQLLANRLEEDKFEKREKGYLSIEDGNWGKIGVTSAQAATPIKVEESKDEKDASELPVESTEVETVSVSEASTESTESEKTEEVEENVAESTEVGDATEPPSEREAQDTDLVETQGVEVEDERVEGKGLEAVIAKESKSKSRRRGKNKNREEG